jgi:hypothetical protein
MVALDVHLPAAFFLASGMSAAAAAEGVRARVMALLGNATAVQRALGKFSSGAHWQADRPGMSAPVLSSLELQQADPVGLSCLPRRPSRRSSLFSRLAPAGTFITIWANCSGLPPSTGIISKVGDATISYAAPLVPASMQTTSDPSSITVVHVIIIVLCSVAVAAALFCIALGCHMRNCCGRRRKSILTADSPPHVPM